MVDDSPASRPHTGLPLAPRLQRSVRLRRALHLKLPVKPPTSRTEQSRRRRFWGNFFVFIAAQVLIGVVAFVLVSDYMADGYIKHSVSDILKKIAGDGRDSKTDQDVVVEIKPPTAQGEATSQEMTAVQKTPATIEPVEKLPAETQESVVSGSPQAEVKVTTSVVEPETVPEAEEQAAAAALIPNLTPLKGVPAAPLPSKPVNPQQAAGQPFRDCATCPELVSIAPGRFVMGAGSEGLGQQVSVTTAKEIAITAPFAIGRYEITFDEWSQCVTDGGCTSQPADENWGHGRRPVINVSFNDINRQYLPWLSRKTGFTYRLPTEAEWEFAARGGASAPAGQAYSFGDDAQLLCKYGNSSDLAVKTSAANWTGINCNDGYATTAPAGSLKPNALGIFDMHGNVWEWTADCWHPQYSARPVKSAEACDTRVLRGGSWASDAAALRTAGRGWERQDKSKNSIGFRVARLQP